MLSLTNLDTEPMLQINFCAPQTITEPYLYVAVCTTKRGHTIREYCCLLLQQLRNVYGQLYNYTDFIYHCGVPITCKCFVLSLT